jgi:hypothetical protein
VCRNASHRILSSWSPRACSAGRMRVSREVRISRSGRPQSHASSRAAEMLPRDESGVLRRPSRYQACSNLSPLLTGLWRTRRAASRAPEHGRGRSSSRWPDAGIVRASKVTSSSVEPLVSPAGRLFPRAVEVAEAADDRSGRRAGRKWVRGGPRMGLLPHWRRSSHRAGCALEARGGTMRRSRSAKTLRPPTGLSVPVSATRPVTQRTSDDA